MTNGVLHRAAGLTIAANASIPGLSPCPSDLTPDVSIHLDSAPPWQHVPAHVFHRTDTVDAQQRPIVTVGGNEYGFCFSYADGTMAWVDTAGTEVWCRGAANATVEDTATYLTGPILGFVLRRRGCLALHASAVAIGDAALLMVGEHGAGKSTTAAALAVRGCRLIADDVLHLRREGPGWVAEPFAGALKLWPDAAALVLGPAVSLRPLTPTWNKRALDLNTYGVTAAESPVRVAWIAFLETCEPPSDHPRFEPIGAAETVVRLATHGSASHLLDGEARAREFHAFADLARGARAVRAIATRQSESFGAFVDLVHQWALDPGRNHDG